MGNYRFRLSDMIPNAWFYKLKDMSKLKNNKTTNRKSHIPTPSSSSSSLSSLSPPPPPNHHPSKITNLPHLSDQRKSYYISRNFMTLHPNSPTNHISEPPRRSSRRKRSTKRSSRLTNRKPRLVSSTSISAGCSCRATLESVWTKPPDHTCSGSSEHDSTLTEHGSDDEDTCKCTSTGNDTVLNLNVLPPIITNKKSPEAKRIQQRTSAEFSETNEFGSLSVKVVRENFVTTSTKAASSPGVKLRTNTPRMKIQGGRRSVSRRSVSSESFAVVVKASKDPGRDFRDSMVEMIVENNIRASKDLEELLACYLSLNSDEYHELIINVFKQIWFDFIRFRLK